MYCPCMILLKVLFDCLCAEAGIKPVIVWTDIADCYNVPLPFMAVLQHTLHAVEFNTYKVHICEMLVTGVTQA